MKKLFWIACIISVIYLLAQISIYQLYYSFEFISKDKLSFHVYSLDKNFVNDPLVIDYLEDTKTDLLLINPGTPNQKEAIKAYKTNYSEQFLDLTLSSGNSLLKDNEYFTSRPNADSNSRQFYDTLFSETIEIYPFSALPTNYWREETSVYISINQSQALFSYLTDLGYQVSEFSNDTYGGARDLLPFTSFAVHALLLMAAAFYVLSLQEDLKVKRHFGYNFISIIEDILWKVFPLYFFITLGLVGLYTTIFNWFSPGYIYVLIKQLPLPLLQHFMSFVIAVSIASLYVVRKINRSSRVRQGRKLEFTFIAVLAKVIVIAVVITTVSGSIFSTLYYLIQNKQHNQYFAQKLQDYVVMPYYGYMPLDMEESKEYENRASTLYKNTVDRFQAFYVESSNYYSSPGEDTLASRYNQKEIYVNDNYLKFNPVLGIDGERIDPDNFNKDKVTILLPEDYSLEEYRKYLLKMGQLDTFPLDLQHYSMSSSIYSYHPYSPGNWEGKLEGAVIFVMNENIPESMMHLKGSLLSGQNYFYKIDDTADPYTQLEPFVKAAGLENNFTAVKFASDHYLERQHSLEQQLASHVLTLILASVLIVVFTFYEISIHFIVFSKQISIKKIHGGSFWSIYRGSLFLRLGILILLMLFTFLQSIPILWSIAISGFDLAIFYYFTKRFEKRTVAATIKGSQK